MDELVIDCTGCPSRILLEDGGEKSCDDCLLSFIIDRPPGAIVFDAAEERALRELGRAGMLPMPNLTTRTG